jgi:hypothetical protein
LTRTIGEAVMGVPVIGSGVRGVKMSIGLDLPLTMVCPSDSNGIAGISTRTAAVVALSQIML